MKKVIVILNRYQGFLAVVATIGILGYTAYQISLTVGVAADPIAIEAERGRAQSQTIKFDKKALSAVENLIILEAKPNVRDVGKPDPFAP